MSARGPIIVTGPDRSGTTLLYALLASHPGICMVRRTNLWRWFDRRYGDLAVPANLDRCLDEMLRYRRLAVLAPDVERLRHDFRSGEATYGRLFDLLHRQHALGRGKPRWGDKSLHTEYCADRILAELPDARILHLVRDPRDRYASIVRRHEGRSKGIGAATGRWLASLRQGHRNAGRYPDRYRLVRYETLASRPEDTMRAVCVFLDEEYVDTMLGLGGVSDRQDWSGNSSFGDFDPGVISTRSIGRYRNVLRARDVAFIQRCVGRLMAAHGYPREPVVLAPDEWALFYGVDLPLRGSRLAGWLAVNRVAEWRRPGVPPHRLAAATAT